MTRIYVYFTGFTRVYGQCRRSREYVSNNRKAGFFSHNLKTAYVLKVPTHLSRGVSPYVRLCIKILV